MCRACDRRFEGDDACPSCGETAHVQRLAPPPRARWRRAAGGFVVGAAIAGVLTVPGELLGLDVSDPARRALIVAGAGAVLALVFGLRRTDPR